MQQEPSLELTKENNTMLLSKKIYAHLIEPNNFMITNFQPLKEGIYTYIQKKTKDKGVISIYVENLRNGASFGINENRGYFQGSLNKLPVAIIILEKIEEGEINFDTMLEVKDEYRTPTFGELYTTDQKEVSIKFLLEKMLKESDNTAFNMLLANISKEELDFLFSYSGYFNKEYVGKNTEIFQAISPKSMYHLYSILYFSTLLNTDNSEYILSLLTDTVFNVKNLAQLPEEVVIAQKFGEAQYDNRNYFHSCGIMYIDESRIFYCIMTEDIPQNEARPIVIKMVKAIFDYVTSVKNELNEYKEAELS